MKTKREEWQKHLGKNKSLVTISFIIQMFEKGARAGACLQTTRAGGEEEEGGMREMLVGGGTCVTRHASVPDVRPADSV